MTNRELHDRGLWEWQLTLLRKGELWKWKVDVYFKGERVIGGYTDFKYYARIVAIQKRREYIRDNNPPAPYSKRKKF